jgi:hypothetical protein
LGTNGIYRETQRQGLITDGNLESVSPSQILSGVLDCSAITAPNQPGKRVKLKAIDDLLLFYRNHQETEETDKTNVGVFGALL